MGTTLRRLSAVVAKCELWLAAFLAVCITLLILLNIVTRYFGAALFWVDELAIYTMVWMTFLGASAALHHKDVVAVTLVVDAVPEPVRRALATCVDIVVFCFALAMLWFCWRWFMPLDLARAGFDIQAFQGATFNFIYAEPTTTLGVPKVAFWSVMWLFSLGAALHSAMHLFAREPRP